jgi:hypothetical protein
LHPPLGIHGTASPEASGEAQQASTTAFASLSRAGKAVAAPSELDGVLERASDVSDLPLRPKKEGGVDGEDRARPPAALDVSQTGLSPFRVVGRVVGAGVRPTSPWRPETHHERGRSRQRRANVRQCMWIGQVPAIEVAPSLGVDAVG